MGRPAVKDWVAPPPSSRMDGCMDPGEKGNNKKANKCRSICCTGHHGEWGAWCGWWSWWWLDYFNVVLARLLGWGWGWGWGDSHIITLICRTLAWVGLGIGSKDDDDEVAAVWSNWLASSLTLVPCLAKTLSFPPFPSLHLKWSKYQICRQSGIFRCRKGGEIGAKWTLETIKASSMSTHCWPYWPCCLYACFMVMSKEV